MITEETKIQDCDLSIRTKKLFEKIEFETVADILKQQPCDLLKYRGFGRQSLKEVLHFVNTNGFFFN